MRAKHGESTTAFEAIYDGTQAFSKGDIVRINAKPQYIGRVVHFTVPQVRARVPDHSAGQQGQPATRRWTEAPHPPRVAG